LGIKIDGVAPSKEKKTKCLWSGTVCSEGLGNLKKQPEKKKRYSKGEEKKKKQSAPLKT